MNATEHAFDSSKDASRCASLLAGARSAPDVVTAVRSYLAAWPKSRVADLQRICDAVHGQFASLHGAGVAPAPELLELDTFLCLACAKLAQIEPGLAPQRSGLADRQPESREHR